MKSSLLLLINTIYKLYVKIIFRKKIKIKLSAKIDFKSRFEGYNFLSTKVRFYNSSIGLCSYIGNDSYINNTTIGRYSCIGPYVKTIIGNHPTNQVSIHPAFYSTMKQSGVTFVKNQKYKEFKFADEKSKKSIIIGNDVWICADVKIVEGVKIGDGAIVLPGAVVNVDVPPYAIVGGVPVKIISYRFSNDDISFLLNVKWWNKDIEYIKKKADFFENIDSFKENIRNE